MTVCVSLPVACVSGFLVAHDLSYWLSRMVVSLKEMTMNKIQSVIAQLQNVMDAFVGVRPFQPLPQAFFHQPNWQETAQALRLPAVWRRNGRHG